MLRCALLVALVLMTAACRSDDDTTGSVDQCMVANFPSYDPKSMDQCVAACKKCQQGLLIPLSDYGRDGAPITYKAWVGTNPDCGFNIRIDNGEISFGRTIGQSLK